jgi:hypothetical protein
MAETFTFDTSGAVARPLTEDGHADGWLYWSDLSPFEQGYVGAIFADFSEAFQREYGNSTLQLRFSDLAPETLDLIRRDCAAFGFEQPRRASEHGGMFWEARNNGSYHGFPPLTPYLDDDGKVRLRETN